MSFAGWRASSLGSRDPWWRSEWRLLVRRVCLAQWAFAVKLANQVLVGQWGRWVPWEVLVPRVLPDLLALQVLPGQRVVLVLLVLTVLVDCGAIVAPAALVGRWVAPAGPAASGIAGPPACLVRVVISVLRVTEVAVVRLVGPVLVERRPHVLEL